MATHRHDVLGRALGATLLSLTASACSNGTCPDGYVNNGTFCEPLLDAGADVFVPAELDATLAIDALPPDAWAADAWAADAWAPDAWAPDAWSPADACRVAFLYADDDGDGFGDPSTGRDACVGAPGLVADDTDCDDAREATHPGATETCNAIDDDCDRVVDDGVLVTFYVDADGDGYGTSVTTEACTMPAGYAARGGDCNDGCASCNPGASEICDGLDNDCDTLIDDGVLLTFYRDADGDLHGLATMSVAACSAPSGYVSSSDDCNDGCPTCYPGRAETCDGLDNNCNTTIDEGVQTAYALDCDADGYVLASPTIVYACSTPARPPGCATTGTVWRTTAPTLYDCADQDARAVPGVASFQTSAIVGPRAAGTAPYDFNCSGTEERERTAIAMCLDATVAGWTTTPIPACGATGTWDACTGALATLTQRCR